MKKILFSVLTLALLACVSCIDNREDGYVPSKVYLAKSGLQEFISTADQTTATASAWATKSGLINSTCTITYSIDPQLLADYNAAKGTTYEMLPTECYTLNQTVFKMEGGDQNAKFEVTYNPAKIFALAGEQSLDKYALPIRVSVEGLETTSQRDRVLMIFNIKASE